MTWRDLWDGTTSAVGDRAHARWLCEVAASADNGDEFLSMLGDEPTARMVAHLDAMLVRLTAGEPLQYVLGRWSFRYIELAIDRRVLIPRPETELVAGVAIEKALAVGPLRTVVDLGTGSGAIGLSMAFELPLESTQVWVTDASADALDVAGANLAGLGRAGRNVRVARGSWFDALPTDLTFDVIVSNPPYVEIGSPDVDRSVTEWEPSTALFAGDDGLADIRILAEGAPGRLNRNGWLVLEIGAAQGPTAAEILSKSGLVEVEVRPDLAGHDRIALGRRR